MPLHLAIAIRLAAGAKLRLHPPGIYGHITKLGIEGHGIATDLRRCRLLRNVALPREDRFPHALQRVAVVVRQGAPGSIAVLQAGMEKIVCDRKPAFLLTEARMALEGELRRAAKLPRASSVAFSMRNVGQHFEADRINRVIPNVFTGPPASR